MKSFIQVGGVQIGGGAPVSIQSMTNTKTSDLDSTCAQIKALEEAGCEIVRLSVYDKASAMAIKHIKKRVSIPLVADIHFDHMLAIAAAENGVDKLRINPGNIGGKERVQALSDCAKAHHIPIRIGVNGGSLEQDLLDAYKRPCPEAMLESALRHAHLLENTGFYDIVLSLKASNVPDTVKAYKLAHEKLPYPLHIGVTEAGMGEFAIMKSSIGLGSLLLDGIGDTMRVSITGDPVQEVYAARNILRAVGLRKEGVEIISCPTCARCHVGLHKMVLALEETMQKNAPNIKRALTIAVMGCAVNGPGEAREADIGIACGMGNGIVFKKGVKFASGPVENMMELLVQEALAMV